MADRNITRHKIITLSENTDKTHQQIADIVGVNRSTVSRVIQRQQESGDCTTHYANCGGQNKKFNERDLRHIKNLVVANPRASANDIKQQLGAAGDVGISTMKRAIIEAGCKTRKPCKKPILSEYHKQRRLAWAENHRDWTLEQWKKVLWSDETMIHLGDGSVKYVRMVDGYPITPAHYNLTCKFPTKVMFWACFAWQGTGRSMVVEGSMTSEAYCTEVIQGRVVQQMMQWYPNNSGIFQQDNAPSHTSRRTRQCLTQHNITLLDWPAQSPDLNPIENLWAIVKVHMRKKQFQNKNEIIGTFLQVWNRDPDIQKMCKTLVESIPRRIQAVIDAKGGYTKY